MALSFDNTLGAGYVGCILTAMLYGVTCVQCFIYSQHCNKDSKLLKYSVLVLWIFDTFHMAMIAYALYWYTITNFMDPTVVGRIPWSISAGILVTPIGDTIVRIFFTYRVWILSRRNYWLSGTISIGVFMMLMIGTVFGSKGFSFEDFAEYAKISWLLYFGLALVPLVDAYIAASLCYFLYKGRMGFQRTDSLVNTLMLYTVNTGLVTSVFGAACFITYAAMPKTYIFLALYFPLGKLYINAMLASLNARESLKREVHGCSTEANSIPMTPGVRDCELAPMQFKPATRLESAVSVEQEIYIKHI